MLFECAIEPEVILAAARSRRDARDFVREFSIGQPNVISDYPAFKKLKSLLRTAIPTDLDDNDLLRLDELIAFMRDARRVQRSGGYDRAMPWANNIGVEADRVGFDHLLTTAPHSGLDCCTLDQLCDDRLGHPRQHLVPRTADELAAAIKNMLRLATRIVFVDPYFRDSRDAWQPFVRFVQAATEGGPADQVEIEVLFNANANGAPSATHLAEKFRREQAALLAKCSPTFKAIAEQQNHEKLHNRYVLTDIGGVSFGVGLAAQDSAHRDDVTLLEEEPYTLRWRQYVELSEFRVVETCSA